MSADHPIAGWTNINDLNFEKEVLQADGLVIVEFYRTSCSSCGMYTPTLIEAAERLEGQAKFLRLNSDTGGRAYMEQYNCTSAPTLAFFHNGMLITTMVGAMPMHYFVMQLKAVNAALQAASLPELKM